MAAELQSAFGVESELLAEGKGIFDVVKDGKLIYSKYQTQCFPGKGEVTHIINGELTA